MNPQQIERALNACYGTLVAPETWPGAFDALARATGAVTETARAQLKAVFARAGLSRQAELVALLAHFPSGRRKPSAV